MNAPLFPPVVVNGEQVPHGAVAAETQNQCAPRGKPGIAWRKAARAIAIRTVLLQEARRQGLSAEPAEIGPDRFETEEEALVRGLLERSIDIRPPSPAAVHSEWARDPARFRAPPLWEVSHILAARDGRGGAAGDGARARARGLANEIAADPGAFARLARDHSDCASRAAGGALGQIGPGDTEPEFEAAIRQLKEGETTTAPVPTRHGWHVIRLDAVAPGAVLPFETVRPKLRLAMEKAAWSRAARDYLAELLAASRISGVDFAVLPGSDT